MHIIEIRDLDGPNLFLPQPAIKVEVAADDAAYALHGEPATADDVFAALESAILDLHAATEQPAPELARREMEKPGHLVVAFTWTHRRYAETLGLAAAKLVIGERDDRSIIVEELAAILASPPEADDAPEMIATATRNRPIIAITGTNGKTTTSRLISFVLRRQGNKVGMTSSAGVYIDNQQVLSGDYSGPAGAHRVFEEPDVDIAVLETARGGMLLRGLGFETADVTITTNVSPDHLGLHGIYSIDKLAEVKSLLPRYTRVGGYAVLNADDPRVLAMREVTPAQPFLVTRQPVSDEVQRHIDGGGWALTLDGEDVVWWSDGSRTTVTSLADVPMTFGGKAVHNVENALCATAGLLALGVPIEAVRDGLRAFTPSSTDNHGRLNVYRLNDGVVIIDFAHNEAGLTHLLAFSRHFLEDGGKLHAVIGTAGDREDSQFRAIARNAAQSADIVVLKDSHRYLRGREMGDMPRLMREGLAESGRDFEVKDYPTERDASLHTFDTMNKGDVVAVMCVEDYDYLLEWLDANGSPWSG